MVFTLTANIGSFGGRLLKLTHDAYSTGCPMALNLYLPPIARNTVKVPVLFFLSGLSCTGDNCAEKGFFQSSASEKGIAIVYPDTSPRGLKIPGEDDTYDFGTGAGFYVDAIAPPWSTNYRMETYIAFELPAALFSSFPELDNTRMSITGHSMGGHGALTLFLKYPGMYKSVSALAPICNPTKCLWGHKAFRGYLGADMEIWKKHDATELIKKWEGPFSCLIDVGSKDDFYRKKQLMPENFIASAKESQNHQNIEFRLHSGYDHSYFFVSTFAADHVNYAAKFLLA